MRLSSISAAAWEDAPAFSRNTGVRRIVGTDINHAEIDQARQLADELAMASSVIQFVLKRSRKTKSCRAGRTTWPCWLIRSSTFAIRSTMLNRAHRLLKPGGVCYFSTWGWYHHQASHVSSIVPIPFATFLFSDRQILDAVRRIVDRPYYRPTLWDSNPPSQRWQECRSLHERPGEYLNKYTIADFRRAMQASEFSQWQLKVKGFSAKRHRLLAACNFLARIPVVQELYHSGVFGRLSKP